MEKKENKFLKTAKEFIAAHPIEIIEGLVATFSIAVNVVLVRKTSKLGKDVKALREENTTLNKKNRELMGENKTLARENKQLGRMVNERDYHIGKLVGEKKNHYGK